MNRLNATARQMVEPGRGILAADESTPTITKRFQALGIESTADSRRDYRALLLTADGASEFISGMMLYDETIRQSLVDGTPIPEALRDRNILPGIKVDTGAKPHAKCPGETVTEGLDGLRGRLEEYAKLGARFAKWRAVIRIGDGTPTCTSIGANAHALARYAALCQEQDIVPIVEPEVLMDGDHDIERCFHITEGVLQRVFSELSAQRVELEGMILKPNMIISALDCSRQAPVEEVAKETIRCLRRNVPAAVPGIAFLSGGQSDELAIAHLNAMNKLDPQPWELSFSYGRALQVAAMKTWGGQAANVAEAQRVFCDVAKRNSEARYGRL